MKLGLSEGSTLYGIKHTAFIHEIIYEGFTKEMVQIKSGHSSIQQTEVYLRSLEGIMNVPDYGGERKLKFEL